MRDTRVYTRIMHQELMSITIGLFILFLQVPFICADALSYRLAPYEKACFYTRLENATVPMKIAFYYSVQPQDQKSGQSNDQRVEVRVVSPQAKMLLLTSDKTTGDYEFTDGIVAGEYMFCFSNVMFVTPKIVDFEVSILEKDANVQDGDNYVARGPNLSQPKLDKFQDTLASLHVDLRTLQNYQRYFRNRDVRNMMTVDATGTLVFWFTIAEIILFGGLSVLQTRLLKSYFASSTKVRV